MAGKTLGGVGLAASFAAACASYASSVIDVKAWNTFEANFRVPVGAGETNAFTNSQNTLTVDNEKNLVVGFDQLVASGVAAAVQTESWAGPALTTDNVKSSHTCQTSLSVSGAGSTSLGANITRTSRVNKETCNTSCASYVA